MAANNNCDDRLLAMSLIILKMQDPADFRKKLRKALKDAGKNIKNAKGADIAGEIIKELNLEDSK